MANSLEKKLIKYVTTDDFGLSPNTTLNIGQDLTPNAAGNEARAAKILKASTNINDYVHVNVSPDAANPKDASLNFGDYIVGQGMANNEMSIGPEEQARLLKRFAESGGNPFNMAVKANKNSGVQIPLMTDEHLSSTLGQKIQPNDTTFVPDPTYAWLNRPSSNMASATLRNTLGAIVGEGPVRRLTEGVQDWAGNKTGINAIGSGVRKAALPAVGYGVATAWGKMKQEGEAEKKKKDGITVAKNVGREEEVSAIRRAFGGLDTNDAKTFPNKGKFADVPNSFQNEVWEDVRSGVDPTKRTSSLYKMTADKVMEKFYSAADFKGQSLEWERSTGRSADNKVIKEKIHKSEKYKDSAEPRIIAPSNVMDPTDRKYGIKAKPDANGNVKRYVGAIVDMGTASVKRVNDASKVARKENDAADPKKSDLSVEKTFKQLFEETKADEGSSSPRYKWVFFEVGGSKTGADSIYTDEKGNIATPDFE